ncbi:unnamed protein product [Clonostachys rhizophaga]|uniref:Class E vacuolar protein-sorting machinery protein HSE1 n=1 Tax=Clonostachys rhizophaga TaxID=160324 RepID=A0A9N9YD82_9HYPO|nr:unnamed protein product [Clonostachys rhizophaga]
MFRAAAAGPYDEAVAKATDENATSEDWGAILEVCDKVSSDANGPKEVVQSLIKRLAHRNANVQLYTLEVAHALCQNCGKNVHREVSSRAFTDALLKLANDRNTHSQVKTKILEKMQDWSDMFKDDPDLGIMYDAYFRLKQSNPTLQAPSAPQKQGLTETDRQKEDDELQMALKLSLQEEERKKAGPSGSGSQGEAGGKQKDNTPPAPVPAGTTAATVSRVRALYDFAPSEPGELEFKRGDVIAVLESVYKDWWRGSLKGKTGIFPLNYVEKLTDPTPDELQREAQMEAEVFAEIKNVEKLLTLLSASNTAPREEDNEEISKLYHQTLAIRPKLIKLIEKYSQKKDDFTQLNEKFIKARRDYEALLESSMSHPPQHSYTQYAMRPAIPGQVYPQAPGGYPQQGPPQSEPQRFYTPQPGPGAQPQDHPPYQPSSPPPNFPAQNPVSSAPFYVAGAEVPSTHASVPQPQPPAPQFGGREQAHVHPQNTVKPPGPINPSSPPQHYSAYGQPPNQTAGGRPPSTYGVQELAASGSGFGSPITGDHPQPPANFSPNPNYSPDDGNPYAGPPSGPSAPPAPFVPGQPSYQTYGTSAQTPPPMPIGQPPQVPSDSMAPPPLQLGGPAYDARQNLPSQHAGQTPQYKPYVPAGGLENSGPSAPAPNDYYHSGAY